MKNFLALILISFFINHSSMAATNLRSPSAVQESTLHFSGDLGIGTASSRFHFGFGLRGELPYNIDGNDWNFGLQTGMYFGTGSNVNDWILPILATARISFRVNNPLKPYIGVGMGPAITHVSFSRGVLGIDASDSSTKFAFLVKPGMDFGDNERYYVELPFGTLGDDFAILPSIGMHF